MFQSKFSHLRRCLDAGFREYNWNRQGYMSWHPVDVRALEGRVGLRPVVVGGTAIRCMGSSYTICIAVTQHSSGETDWSPEERQKKIPRTGV